MFKKAKPQVEPPPTAPTLDEMLADIETFEISQPTGGNAVSSATLERILLEEPESLTLETWWQAFDEYEQKVKKLESMEGTLDAYRDKLLACQEKLEKNVKNLRDGILKQQALIKEVADC